MLITVDGKLYTETGIINFPEMFKQVLSIFKHLEVEKFSFDKNKLAIEFKTAIPVDRYESELKKFTGYAELRLSPTALFIQLKSNEKTITNDKDEHAKQVAKEVVKELKANEEAKDAAKPEKEKFNPEKYIKGKADEDTEYKVINVEKKLRNIEAGTYVINFDEGKFGWVLIYTQSGNRIPVKEPNTIVEIPEKAKSISPIASSNSKK